MAGWTGFGGLAKEGYTYGRREKNERGDIVSFLSMNDLRLGMCIGIGIFCFLGVGGTVVDRALSE